MVPFLGPAFQTPVLQPPGQEGSAQPHLKSQVWWPQRRSLQTRLVRQAVADWRGEEPQDCWVMGAEAVKSPGWGPWSLLGTHHAGLWWGAQEPVPELGPQRRQGSHRVLSGVQLERAAVGQLAAMRRSQRLKQGSPGWVGQDPGVTRRKGWYVPHFQATMWGNPQGWGKGDLGTVPLSLAAPEHPFPVLSH